MKSLNMSLERIHFRLLWSGFTATMVMCLSLFHFLFSAKNMTKVDMYVILFIMLISGLVVFLVPIVEMLLKLHVKSQIGKMMYIFAGMTGIIEAVVSLIALYTGDYLLYDIFNFTGLVLLIGFVAIFGVLHFFYGAKSFD